MFEKEDLIEGFKVIWFIINNLFLSFEINGGSCTLSQNTTGEIRQKTMCALSFEILLKCASYIQFIVIMVYFCFTYGEKQLD